MVVTCRVPTVETLVRQARVAVPFNRTVQAPHWPTPQPNLVPFILSTSRSTHSRGMSAGTSTVCVRPFTLSEYAMKALLDAAHGTQPLNNSPRRRSRAKATPLSVLLGVDYLYFSGSTVMPASTSSLYCHASG